MISTQQTAASPAVVGGGCRCAGWGLCSLECLHRVTLGGVFLWGGGQVHIRPSFRASLSPVSMSITRQTRLAITYHSQVRGGVFPTSFTSSLTFFTAIHLPRSPQSWYNHSLLISLFLFLFCSLFFFFLLHLPFFPLFLSFSFSFSFFFSLHLSHFTTRVFTFELLGSSNLLVTLYTFFFYTPINHRTISTIFH